MTEPPRDIPEADRDWFGGRRWTGIGAIGVLIVLGIAVIVLVMGWHDRRAPNSNPPSSVSMTPTTAEPFTVPRATAAPLPTTTPTTAPSGVHWSLYETVALPALSGAGPAHVAGAIATGYARSPTGALLAVANEGYRYGLAPDATWRAAAAAMLARSGGYRAWLKARAANPYGKAGATGGDQLAQIAGFQFVSYTPTDAVIQLVTRDSSGNLQVGADHVAWVAGDWKYVTGPDGGQTANVQTIDSLANFIEWSGV